MSHAIHSSGWRQALGTVVAFAGGFAAAWLILPASPALFMLATFVVGGVAALLIAAWQGVALVSVALWLAPQAAEVAYGALHGYLVEPHWWGGALEVAGIMVALALVPAVIGSTLALVIETSLMRRPWRRKSAPLAHDDSR